MTTAVTLPVFEKFLVISTSLNPSGSGQAVVVTLIGWAVVDIKFWPIGSFNLRCLSLPNPVSPDPISYSLLESLLES
jgi:hypothetical protein